jgi:hypothetical protein
VPLANVLKLGVSLLGECRNATEFGQKSQKIDQLIKISQPVISWS